MPPVTPPTTPAPPYAIIIPARYQSSRFPGKPLAPLRGADGSPKPLIQRSWECARAIAGADNVWVASDDARIAQCVEGFGGQVVMTSPDCRNGTERVAEAAAALPHLPDIIVNLQGDAPLTPGFVVPGLVAALAADPAAAMATPAMRCSASTYAHLVADQAAGRVGGTCVVFGRAGYAHYFSKRVIPHVSADDPIAHEKVHLHLGVYAYTRDALKAYCLAPPSTLELAEGLEQLRFLDARPIRMVAFDPAAWDPIELNNPEDVPAIEAILARHTLV